MNLERELNEWMDANQTDIFEFIREAMEEFESAHPGMDESMIKLNALSMADRRFMARAISEVVGKYLPNSEKGA